MLCVQCVEKYIRKTTRICQKNKLKHQKSKAVITAAHFLTSTLHYSFLLETHFLM